MSQIRSTVETYLRDRLAQMPFDAAVKRTADDLALLPGSQQVLEELVLEHNERVKHKTKLTELGTARQGDLLERGWYGGVSKDDGVWARLRERMSTSALADGIPAIDASTEEIVASMAEPLIDTDRRVGLVIGNVQSGKTANYSAVIAKALDSGYKFVLVLSGIHNNLRRQTQQRLERDLGVLTDRKRWYRLTDVEGDFGKAHVNNASSIVDKHDHIIAVVKKNSTRLRNLHAFLKSLDAETKRETPFLIIDDESDQATPDSSSRIDDDPTAINKLMRGLWSEVSNGTYIGYTATPFANVFMNPNELPADQPEELYPRDFIHVMPTPPTYFGAEQLFGLDSDTSDERDPDVPDVIRMVPESEALLLAPKGPDAGNAEPPVTDSLEKAIRWFIVASAVRRMRGQQKDHSTMLVHTTHRVGPHFAMRDAVNAFLNPLKQLAREGDVESFRNIFHDEIDRAAGLYTGYGEAPTWPRVSTEIPNVLRNLRVSVDNGSALEDERLSYGKTPQTVIVIGGGTLSRGLTLEGLFVSFFTRSSNTYDTLLQMGRWFGYRNAYEDLQRIWLAPGLGEDYQFLASVEADVRLEIARMTAAGETPRSIGVRVQEHPGRLQVTSPAKMKHVWEVQADFEGYRLQTTRFNISQESRLTNNALAAEALLSRIAGYRSSDAPNLFENVPITDLHEFFTNFSVHERFSDALAETYQWSRERLPTKTWNVVVPSHTKEPGGLRDGSLFVKTVRRAPIASTDEELRATGDINIRALMSGQDIVADLRLQGSLAGLTGNEEVRRLTNNEQYDLRRKTTGADGRGLLILYPISRKSHATSGARRDMDGALRAVNPELAADQAPPIVGIAVIAPFDTDRTLVSKGTYVAVKPVFGTVEEEYDVEIVDNEGDFRGDNL